jgi:hypothetical protein
MKKHDETKTTIIHAECVGGLFDGAVWPVPADAGELHWPAAGLKYVRQGRTGTRFVLASARKWRVWTSGGMKRPHLVCEVGGETEIEAMSRAKLVFAQFPGADLHDMMIEEVRL